MNSYCPGNREEWRKWLESNHENEDSIWLIIRKKDAPNPNLNWSEAVDEAICFGWIDSVKKAIDKETYKQYFSKRKAKSIWSKINKNKVDNLIGQGLMAEAGLRSINIAKNNGSWTSLDKVEALVMPEDLRQAFQSRKGAWEYYEGLSKSVKKRLLHWVTFAKREETRKRRISDVTENASNGMLPKMLR